MSDDVKVSQNTQKTFKSKIKFGMTTGNNRQYQHCKTITFTLW